MMMTRPLPFGGHLRRGRHVGAAVGIVGAVALCAAVLYALSIIGAVVWVLPAAAAAVAWWLTQHGIPWLPGAADGQRPGRHHRFGKGHIHIRWGGKACAIDACDALRIMEMPTDERMLRRLASHYGDDRFFQDENGRWWFCETALLDWLHRKAHEGNAQALGFHRWLAHKALPPMHRRSGAMPP